MMLHESMCVLFWICISCTVGRENVVGIASRNGLEGLAIEFRSGPWTHPTACKMDTVSFCVSKAAGSWR